MTADHGLPLALPELLILLRGPNEYVVFNPLVRTHAIGDAAFVSLLSALRDASADEADLPSGPFHAIDATIPTFRDGLLGDPTGLDREASLEDAEPLWLEDTLALARRLMLVADDVAAYADYPGARRNVLDRTRRGTLHQRVGEHVMLTLREDPDAWWVSQKFTDDHSAARAGLYADVQMRFVEEYYDSERVRGVRVLDFGCGPGLFTRHFARHGAEVVGMDTNEEHLSRAAQLASNEQLERVRLMPLELPVAEGLSKLGDERFDLIFLSDVMMFYFHPYDPALELDPVDLLVQLRERLAEGGTIAVLEPNGTFWQQPWLGDPERPFTVLTEYEHRRYGVTPTLEQLSRAAESAGLAFARVREPVAEPAAGDRARNFAAEFPVWWFFELRALDE